MNKLNVEVLTCPLVFAGSSYGACRRPGARRRCARWRRARRPPRCPPPLPPTLSTCSLRAPNCPAFSSYIYLYDPLAVS